MMPLDWQTKVDSGSTYTLPQKKRKFSEVAFILGKSVLHLILYQKSFVECSW